MLTPAKEPYLLVRTPSINTGLRRDVIRSSLTHHTISQPSRHWGVSTSMGEIWKKKSTSQTDRGKIWVWSTKRFPHALVLDIELVKYCLFRHRHATRRLLWGLGHFSEIVPAFWEPDRINVSLAPSSYPHMRDDVMWSPSNDHRNPPRIFSKSPR